MNMFEISKTILLVIDVQGKLASLMYEKEKLFKNLKGIIQAAQILGIPILCTEQVPEKIGKTIAEITPLLTNIQPLAKKSFSCLRSERFIERLKSLPRKQIIVTGIEAHVCVYQTVADLMRKKYAVMVVADCISSRSPENKCLALERMKQLGAGITSLEMILCELLRTSEHKKFKGILSLMK